MKTSTKKTVNQDYTDMLFYIISSIKRDPLKCTGEIRYMFAISENFAMYEYYCNLIRSATDVHVCRDSQ